MIFGDFGNFSGWSMEEHALNKLAYDETHKKSGGASGGDNGGCAIFPIFIAALIAILLIWR